jgi:hypothetical protein
MRKFYLVSAVIVAILILVISAAQFGATCVWYLIGTNTPPFLVLLQVALLGAVMGGLLILWWKQPKPGSENEEDEGGEDESAE